MCRPTPRNKNSFRIFRAEWDKKEFGIFIKDEKKKQKGEIRMSFSIIEQAGKTVYNVKKFVIDAYDDLKSIDKDAIAPGSVAFCIESSENYMLNNKREWKKVILSTGGSGTGSGGTEDDVIYDGGEATD